LYATHNSIPPIGNFIIPIGGFLFSKFKQYPSFLQNYAIFWNKCVNKLFFRRFSTEKSYCKLQLQCYTKHIQLHANAYFHFQAQHFLAL